MKLTKEKIINALAEPQLFMESFLKVVDKNTRKLVPLKLNSEQQKLLKALQEHNRIIILKPRKIGVSTLIRAWAFYNAYVSLEPIKFGTVSYERESADEILNMDKTFHVNMPSILERNLSKSTGRVIQFADTGAELRSFTAGRKGGARAFTLTSGHLSEFAYYEEQEEVLTSMDGAVGDAGQLIIETTANTPGDKYHQLIKEAESGESEWHLVTFWWWEHSDYRDDEPVYDLTEEEESLQVLYNLDLHQIAWRRRKIQTLGIEKFNKEYPACVDDAFRNLSSTFIPSQYLDDIEIINNEADEVFYESPNSDEEYAMGVDVSGGVGGDYAAIVVTSKVNKRIVYRWRHNLTKPEDLPERIIRIAKIYNNAEVLVESNNHGHLTLYRLEKDFKYQNLWTDKTGKHWITTQKSKLEAMAYMRQNLASGLGYRIDKVLFSELQALIQVKLCPEAPIGSHDDCAMAYALSLYCGKDAPEQYKLIDKEALRQEWLREARARRIKTQPIPWQRNRLK